MGYDMYWQVKTEGRDRDDSHYFRANIWGMGTLRKAMHLAGVMNEREDEGRDDMPKFPDWKKEWDALDLEEMPEEELTPEQKEYVETCKAARSKRSNEPGKIPYFKFCSNDGWLVTPEESRIIAEGLTKLLAEVDSGQEFTLPPDGFFEKEPFILSNTATSKERLEFIREWADYNKRASDANVAYAVY